MKVLGVMTSGDLLIPVVGRVMGAFDSPLTRESGGLLHAGNLFQGCLGEALFLKIVWTVEYFL